MSFLICTAALYANYLKKYTLGYLIGIFILPTFLFSYFIQVGLKAGMTFIYFAFMLFAIIFFDNRKKIYLVAGYFFILNAIGTYWAIINDPPLSNEYSIFDVIIGIIIVMIIISFGVEKFIRELKVQEKVLRKKNEDLSLKTKNLELLVMENKRKIDLLGIVSHDLRGSAISFKELTRNIQYLIKKDDQKRLVDLLDYFERDGEKLFYRLNNLLNWVISQRENLEIFNSKIQPKLLIDELVSHIKLPIEKKETLIKNTITISNEIVSDKNILQVIIHNFIDNAIKYTPNKSLISIGFHYSKTHYSFFVKDNGYGLEAKKLKELQEGIFNNKITSKGYGLGMEICNSLIQMLHGKMEIESKTNSGTTVSIIFPIQNNL